MKYILWYSWYLISVHCCLRPWLILRHTLNLLYYIPWVFLFCYHPLFQNLIRELRNLSWEIVIDIFPRWMLCQQLANIRRSSMNRAYTKRGSFTALLKMIFNNLIQLVCMNWFSSISFFGLALLSPGASAYYIVKALIVILREEPPRLRMLIVIDEGIVNNFIA